MESVSLLL